MTIYLILGLASFIFILAYFIAAYLVFKKNNKGDKFSLRNHFPYEISPKKGSPYFYINILLLLPCLLLLTSLVYFTANQFNILHLLGAICALLCGFSIFFVHFIPMKYLREHCYIAITLIVSTLLLNVLILYKGIRLYQIANELIYLVPIIFGGIVTAISLLLIFFPSIFDLSLDKDAYGNPIRKKTYPLAIAEWTMILIAVLTPLMLMFIYK